MTTGVIDPYDIAVRVDLGEIQEMDLPKIFSGDTKGLAECKRHLYKLRSDRILYMEMAVIDLVQKLKLMTDERLIDAALRETLNALEKNLITEAKTVDSRGRSHKFAPSVGITNKTFHSNVFEYDVYRTNAQTSKQQKAVKSWNPENDVILHIRNTVDNSTITTMDGWSKLIDKRTFNRVVNAIRQTNKLQVGILRTGERRSNELKILEDETIPFLSRLWIIGFVGDVLTMLGKALGGNL